MAKKLKDEIIEQVEGLEEPQQRKVLDFARGLRTAKGTSGSDLLRFAGSIAPADLKAISQAIQEGCEKVEPNGW